NGAEHKRRLARSRDAGEHRQAALRDVDADVLEVVLARALDTNHVVGVRGVRLACHGAQLTAFLTRALIFASSAAVSFVSAKSVGHMAPSSSFALSLKPSVAYLALNFAPD